MDDRPMVVGPMMSDIVSWHWSKSSRWWMARLSDGTELYAIHHSRGRGSHWSARVRGDRTIDMGGRHDTPRAAQLAAVNEYLRQEGKPPIE